MSPFAIAVIALSMSADAFAAALARGARVRPTLAQAAGAGLVFAAIETMTPLIGWGLGRAASAWVEAVDHWIAWALLCAVGANLLRAAWKGDGGDGADAPRRGGGAAALVATAVATSIDAGAVGVSLAFLDVDIWVAAAAIGCATFLMTTAGMTLGAAAGARWGRTAELAGGCLLIAIGWWVLLTHTGVIPAV